MLLFHWFIFFVNFSTYRNILILLNLPCYSSHWTLIDRTYPAHCYVDRMYVLGCCKPATMTLQFLKRHHRAYVPRQRIAARSELLGALLRLIYRTVTLPTISSTTWKRRVPTRRPLKWCSRRRCPVASPSSCSRSSKNGRNTASGCWPAPSLETDQPRSLSRSALKRMVRSLLLFLLLLFPPLRMFIR